MDVNLCGLSLKFQLLMLRLINPSINLYYQLPRNDAVMQTQNMPLLASNLFRRLLHAQTPAPTQGGLHE